MKISFITKPFVVELLGIAYLAAILKREGHEVRLVKDDNLSDLDYYVPDVLAFSATTGQHHHYLNVNKRVKKKKMITVFGGPHATYFPELAKEEGVDWIVQGEAEISFPDLLMSKQKGVDLKGPVLGPYPLVQNLDAIPFPDREFLYTYEENRKNPIKNVLTSRGCPFSCPYCFNSIYRQMYKGQKWTRYRSPDNVIRECIELREKYPLEMIFFQDDEFLMNPRILELLDLYRRNVKVPFHAQLRIEWLTEEKAQALKLAGCLSVTFAIESGDQEIRQGLLKRNITDKQIIDGAKLLKKYGLMFRTENMVGLPGETLPQMMKTYELNRQVNPTIGWCSLFQPYPNLPLSKYAQDKGYWNGEMNMKESFFEESILNFKNKEVIENLQRVFGIAVKYQLFSWVVWCLIHLPKNRLFDWMSKKFKFERYKKLYGLEKKK